MPRSVIAITTKTRATATEPQILDWAGVAVVAGCGNTRFRYSSNLMCQTLTPTLGYKRMRSCVAEPQTAFVQSIIP